jgi:asparagine synthase (glutamine-hydrolysing)
MPGLFGHIRTSKSNSAHLTNGLNLLCHTPGNTVTDTFEDRNILAGKVTNNSLLNKVSILNCSGVSVWMDGYWTNENEIKQKYQIEKNDNLLQAAYRRNNLNQVLLELDGYFSAVIYDVNKEIIILLSDRLGFRPLYYRNINQNFSWATEIKSFLALPDFQTDFNIESFHTFIALGHLVADQTWFNGVKLIPPGTILTYHIKDQKLNFEKYWSWQVAKQKKISKDEAAEELSSLLKKAVNRRAFPNTDVGLLLSGGLDSRTILSCLPDKVSVELINFGEKKSWDVEYAHAIHNQTNFPLRYFELKPDMWLKGKEEAIWQTDGLKNMIHLHMSPFLTSLNKYDGIFDGILGGILLGGIYLEKSPATQIKNMLKKLKTQKEVGDLLMADYQKKGNIEAFIIENRTRRFSTFGGISFYPFASPLNPFSDKEILDFIISLPNSYRKYSKLFMDTLGRLNKGYLKNIPWQRTGISIKNQQSTIFIQHFKIIQILKLLGFLPHHSFADYENWKMKKASQIESFFENIPEILQKEFPYLSQTVVNKENYERISIEELSRFLTLSIWVNKTQEVEQLIK